MFHNIAAVLFDLDGTLIDSAPDLGFAADKMRTDRGYSSFPLQRYRPLAGSGARGMLDIAFGLAPGHADYAAFCEEFYVNYERCLTERTQVFEGVPQLLAWLERRPLPWGVVTNKSTRFTQPLTQAMPLFAGAGAVISGDTMPHTKPHPAPLLEAARRLGLDPSRCLYVGDDERDVAAGRAAGMATVAAAYGYLGKSGDFSSWGAQASIAAPLELLDLLAGA
jgi:2-phosphoglycolate phosphatase